MCIVSLLFRVMYVLCGDFTIHPIKSSMCASYFINDPHPPNQICLCTSNFVQTWVQNFHQCQYTLTWWQKHWQWLCECLGEKLCIVYECLNGMVSSRPVGCLLTKTSTHGNNDSKWQIIGTCVYVQNGLFQGWWWPIGMRGKFLTSWQHQFWIFSIQYCIHILSYKFKKYYVSIWQWQFSVRR